MSGLLFGSGFGLFEHGAKATGMAGAFTAQADDPSALFYNPAGIAFQKRSLYMGTTAILPSADFDGVGPYPGYGVSESMPDQKFFPSNGTIVYPLNDRWTFAVGSYNPFGLGTRWEDPSQFTGRYISTLAAIRAGKVQPTIAYKPQDNFSIAFGISYFGAKVSLEQYVPSINPYTQMITNVGHVRMDGGMDTGIGYDFGLLYKFNSNWSFGFSYHSAIDIDFDGTAKFTQIPTGFADFDAIVSQAIPWGKHDAATSIEFPAVASIGLATTAIDRWTFEVDVNYAGWSSFDQLALEITDDPELGTVRVSDWEDVYNYRFGFEFRPNDALAWRGGIVYDESPQPLWDVGPVLPDSNRTGYCAGFGYTSGSFIFDLGYMYLTFDESDTAGVSQDQYYGTFSSSAHLLGVAFTYSF